LETLARERAQPDLRLSVGSLLEVMETVRHGSLCFASRYPNLWHPGVKRDGVSAR